MAGFTSSGGQDGGGPAGRPHDDLGWERTVTRGVAPGVGAGGTVNAGGMQQVIRHGPGVPAGVAAGQAPPTAEQVWQAGTAAGATRGRRARLIASTAVSVALLIASGVVIFLRLHHAPFGVTGVAITGQVRSGCTVDVTGRISTTGGAGTVTYQWIFSSQPAAPHPVSQSAAAGQPAVYVTAAIQGQGHGRVTQRVTLEVLDPGRGTASVPVTVSC